MSLDQPTESANLGQPLPSLGGFGASKSSLGSLAQSARNKQINQVRGFFIVIGLLSTVFNIIELVNVRDIVHMALDAQVKKQGLIVAPAQLQAIEDQQIGLVILLDSAIIAVGVAFFVLGILVRKFPVPSVLVGLVLYIGVTALFLYLLGAEGAGVLVIRVIIIIGLIKSLKTAIVYQREQKEAATLAGLSA